ncbi:MAG: hypothetical protein AAF533_04120 [Acidobacteriota bacterium]
MSSHVSPTPPDWLRACGLHLTATCVRPDALADPVSARLLEIGLEQACREAGVTLLGWVALPGSLDLLTPEGARPERWQRLLGRIKGAHGRRDNRRVGRTGAVWRPGSRIRFVRRGDLERARTVLHERPVRAGLAERAADWPFSSWRAVHEGAVPGFVERRC